MSEAVIAQKSPYPIDVEEGKSYYWCAMWTKVPKQPFCDGSHKGTTFNPVAFQSY